jgi:Flp pilus assembly protein TadG
MIRLKKFLKNETGQSMVLMAGAFIILCTIAAFTVDIGRVSAEKSSLQNAADAAALSGAMELPDASLASAAASDYAEANGAGDAQLVIHTPYNGDSKKIEVICTKTVNYSFARILGMTSTDVTVRAVAEKAGMAGGAFDFTVFSGSTSDTMTYNGSNLYIGGSAHANDSIRLNGSSMTITQTAEAVNSFRANGSSLSIDTCRAASITINGSGINVENMVYTAAPYIEMPDFSGEILTEAEASGEVYTGNMTYNGSYIDVSSPIYIDGDLTINGSHFSGQGIICATGNITFNGSNLVNSSSDAVCFYSANGDIRVNGSNAELYGLVYAPNGDIRMNGSNQTIHGRVIADTITFNGSNTWIAAGANDLDSLPGYSLRLVD